MDSEFRIVTGAHRGASVALAKDDLLVIGGDESCDIRLIDAGIAPRHAALVSQGATLSIRQLDGALTVNGQPISASARTPLPAGAEILLGESGVKLQLGGVVVVANTEPANTNAGKAEKPSRPIPRRSHAIALAVLSMVVVAGIGLAAQKLTSSREVSARPSATPAAKAPVSGDELVEQVRNVFRAYGYQAELTYIGHQKVQVGNLEETHDRVRQATARVRSDVPQLAALVFATPDASSPPEQPRPYADASEGRISARVDGETAYLAAANGARYFVGSVLPGGHVVRRITEQAVQLERDGEISWFRF